MEILDRVLWLVELVGVVWSLVFLVASVLRPERRRVRRATLLCALVGLTVAQPLGIVATEQRGAPPRDARRSSPSDVHIVRALGSVPALPFILYRRDKIWPPENGPRASLRARSWSWLPLLTNSANISGLCGGDTVLCWNPSARRPSQTSDLVHVYTKGSTTWVTVTPFVAKGYLDRRALPSFTWRLSIGVASVAGLVYWALALVLIVSAQVGVRRESVGH